MRLRVQHRTTYRYDEPVTTSHHELHLTPRDGHGQSCHSHVVLVEPAPGALHERRDYFDNRVFYFGIEEPHRCLDIVAQSDVRIRARPQSLLLDKTPWEEVRDTIARERRHELLDAYSFVFDSPYVAVQPGLREFALASFARGRPLIDAVVDLTQRIFSGFTYDPRATRVQTPLADVIRERRGVCQDFAHFATGCLRAMQLPARYMSGYLLTSPPPGQPRLVGCDASHAWVSTYLPHVGWVDFDPSNNLVPAQKHVVVAHGRDFGDVTPVRGVILGGARHTLRVTVDVEPVTEEGEAER
ncbi:MAG: transglutaminase family protein [Myxococcota bacterium]|nr:transglutaminase family protein [Myxococcota bacterium]